MTIRPTPALEIDSLRAGYGRVAVLRDVSLTVPAGSVIALVGANGAGKSTLLRAIAGFVSPTAGSIRIDGRDVTRSRPHQRFADGLCLVPEGRGVFRSLTVRENLVMQANRGDEAGAIERAAAAFPMLGRRLGQQAGTLSGGEQQMLAMAAAHVRNASLILVDEASLGLAPMIVDEIFTFLEVCAQSGSSLLLVDQFVHRALTLATSAYVLARGSIVYDGPAADLLADDLFDRYVGSTEASRPRRVAL